MSKVSVHQYSIVGMRKQKQKLKLKAGSATFTFVVGIANNRITIFWTEAALESNASASFFGRWLNNLLRADIFPKLGPLTTNSYRKIFGQWLGPHTKSYCCTVVCYGCSF